MAVQRRNDELVDLLSADFIRSRLPVVVYENGGGWGEWSIQDVGSTAFVILPNGTYDAANLLHYSFVVVENGGGKATGIGSLTPGTDDTIYDDGTDICVLRVNANGEVDVRRTAGTALFDVKLRLEWM